MKRRNFLNSAGGGLAGILAAGAAPALAQGASEVKWRLASSFPKSLDTLFGAADAMVKRVAAATGGKFQIQIFASGEIVPGLQVADAVQNGTVQCGHTAPYYYVGKDPTFAFGTAVPFGLNARQINAWWYAGGGEALMNEFFRDFGFRAMLAGNTGAQMGGWYRKEIKSVADLKGLKLRTAGMAGEVLSRLGVVPQQLAAGDVYSALEKGTLDGAEFVGPYDDEKLGLAKVAKYYYYPGWWEGGAALALIVNTKAWEALPKEYQAILEAAAAESNALMLARYDAANPPALRKIVAAGGQLRAFPRPVMEAGYKATQELFAEIGAKNAKFRRVHEHMAKFLEDQVLWFRVAESAFDNFMVTGRKAAPPGAAAKK
ncbi:MAG: TRAP transporter substrate-binding protein [Betaproteobacteria bacterium]|nr:TRAP transporter substrate-binding protein [Betaproteobacteria bacterium]